MLKAVFFDIDGTLVSFKTHSVPQSTVNAINLLKEKGIKVFIATGRPLIVIDNLGDLKFDAYVTLNGACCFDQQHNLISKHAVDKTEIKKLIDYVQNKESFSCVFVREKDCFANYLDEVAYELFSNLNISVEKMGQVRPIEEALESDIYQVTCFFDQKKEDELAPFFPNCSSARWSPAFSDFIAKDVSKQTGIDEVLKIHGISIEETMAFGDGGNDIPMLRHAKWGVAMGNAKDNVKQHANYVTDSVDDDGIWNALKHFDII